MGAFFAGMGVCFMGPLYDTMRWGHLTLPTVVSIILSFSFGGMCCTHG